MQMTANEVRMSDWSSDVCSSDLEPSDAGDLLSRIDAVSPSLALAQAAQESGWGTSRFALRAKALFGQRSWGEAAIGLAPAEAESDDFKARDFTDLTSSVRARPEARRVGNEGGRKARSGRERNNKEKKHSNIQGTNRQVLRDYY